MLYVFESTRVDVEYIDKFNMALLRIIPARAKEIYRSHNILRISYKRFCESIRSLVATVCSYTGIGLKMS